MYYNTVIDMITSLENDKIDAIIDDSCTIIYYNRETGGKLRLLDGYLKPFQFGFICAKTAEGSRLAAEMSEYIDKIRADGTLDEIDKNWMSEGGAAEMAVDYNDLPSPNGVLKLATTGTSPPFSYIQDDVTIGYDIDIASRFCKEYGYGLEVGIMSFDGIIPAVSSGKYDIGGNHA